MQGVDPWRWTSATLASGIKAIAAMVKVMEIEGFIGIMELVEGGVI
jgi:hypothetical protein